MGTQSEGSEKRNTNKACFPGIRKDPLTRKNHFFYRINIVMPHITIVNKRMRKKINKKKTSLKNRNCRAKNSYSSRKSFFFYKNILLNWKNHKRRTGN